MAFACSKIRALVSQPFILSYNHLNYTSLHYCKD
nr:MAG TPA: hypothetical protein [Caudoviricetes sp.]